MKETIKFSLSDIDVIREETNEDGSLDFALARLKFMSTSKNDEENSQGFLLDSKVLKNDAKTALGKFITGKINKYSKDLMSHMEDNDIFGYIPPNSEITFEEIDGRLFAICEAVISKIYCRDVINAFKMDNDRCVSIEASIETHPNNPKLIMSFIIHSITILAKHISGAVLGANMEIVKFSSNDAKTYYDNINKKEENVLKKFAKERQISNQQQSQKIELNQEDGLNKEKNKEVSMEEDIKLEEANVEMSKDKTDDVIMNSDSEETLEIKQAKEVEVEEGEAKKEEVEVIKESEKEEEEVALEEKGLTWTDEEVIELTKDTKFKDSILGMFSKETTSVEGLVKAIIKLEEEKEILSNKIEKVDEEKANVKFSQIMGIAKLKLNDSKYDELYEKGKTLKFSELEMFEKDVKACICDLVVFAEKQEDNQDLSYGTHMKLTETNSNSLWN